MVWTPLAQPGAPTNSKASLLEHQRSVSFFPYPFYLSDFPSEKKKGEEKEKDMEYLSKQLSVPSHGAWRPQSAVITIECRLSEWWVGLMGLQGWRKRFPSPRDGHLDGQLSLQRGSLLLGDRKAVCFRFATLSEFFPKSLLGGVLKEFFPSSKCWIDVSRGSGPFCYHHHLNRHCSIFFGN